MKQYPPEIQELINELFNNIKLVCQNEFDMTANPWHACLQARISNIDILAGIICKEVGNEHCEKMRMQIKIIMDDIKKFRMDYPSKYSSDEDQESRIDAIIAKMYALKTDYIN